MANENETPTRLEWSDVHERVQDAVIREMASAMGAHYVAFKTANDVNLASERMGDGYREPITRSVQEHSGVMAAGFRAAIALLARDAKTARAAWKDMRDVPDALLERADSILTELETAHRKWDALSKEVDAAIATKKPT